MLVYVCVFVAQKSHQKWMNLLLHYIEAAISHCSDGENLIVKVIGYVLIVFVITPQPYGGITPIKIFLKVVSKSGLMSQLKHNHSHIKTKVSSLDKMNNFLIFKLKKHKGSLS